MQQRLLREALTGDVFLFVGCDPSRLKILCWDEDGLWLKQAFATRRLSQGRFQAPRAVSKDGVASNAVNLKQPRLTIHKILLDRRLKKIRAS